jgi:hypothetical protein
MEVVVDARRDPRGQGERGEKLAAAWFIEHDAIVFVPALHTLRDYDFIVDWEDGSRPQRIQVKTTTQFVHGRWSVSVCTRGGNRSWNGLVKRLDATKYERLFVVVADGRRWLIPSDRISGGTRLHLGGPKYAEWELDPGPPLVIDGSALDSRAPWRGSRAVKGDGL